MKSEPEEWSVNDALAAPSCVEPGIVGMALRSA
ncbi:EVE domain-containing protein [Polaromonas sp. JS666]|nr:EVE domain-containing protein [Polaromonas sp. JS666]